MKNILKKIIIVFLRFFFSFFYDKKYLKGKYFDNTLLGWKWCFQSFYFQKILRINSKIPWPCSYGVSISNPKNIEFDVNDINNFQVYGSYFQNFDAKIVIGKGSYIAMNCGIITANHDFNDLDKHQKGKNVIIGEKCWIGMNSIILPGVILGNNTIVGAGSIVTKSFVEGNCVIAGNPAKKIKDL